MPEISRFLGIVITMYFNDHNPPHFHVRYEDFRALVGIEPLELGEGQLPPRVLGLVMEWGGDAPGRADAELDDLGRRGYFQAHRSAGLRRFKMIWVTDAKTLPDYRLWVRFSDNTEGEVDLRDFVASDARPIVAALRDSAAFSAIRVEMDTVVWANGFDLAPEFLHARAKAHAAA